MDIPDDEQLLAVLERSPVWMRLYQTNAKYRALWDAGVGPGQHGKVAEQQAFQKYNHWLPLHMFAVDNADNWDAAKAKKFYKNWEKDIPNNGGCGCQEKWKKLGLAPNYSSAKAFFEWTWQAHNAVSEQMIAEGKKAKLISLEQCQAIYLQQPSMDDCCIAVTSLSPHRLERQTLCLDTWQRAGLTIAAVQAPGEDLQREYPQVSHWFTAESAGPPTINELADVAITLDTPVIIINADIEIHGEQRLIRNGMQGGLLIGVRHNYRQNWWNSKEERWGLDVFGISPDFAASLPKLGLRISRPMWDYWLPYHCKLLGNPKRWIKEPLFFHRSHPQAWSQDDWQAGSDIFCEHYGLKNVNWQQYREELEQ